MIQENIEYSTDRKKLSGAILIALIISLLLWVIKVLEWTTDGNWYFLGILPRHTKGLIGIITAPLIHHDFIHLLSNSIPLFLLGIALFYFYERIAAEILIWIYITTGLWMWVFARDTSYHIGASGVLYGIASFLFFSGLIRRNRSLMSVSGIIMVLYGGLVYGMFPNFVDSDVSWEGHLMGALAGLLISFYFRKYRLHKDDEGATDDKNDNTKGNVSATWEGNYEYQYKSDIQKNKDPQLN